MNYYAQFVSHVSGVFRMDTRIYLNGNHTSQSGGQRVAAVIGKNPGSASAAVGSGWGPLHLGKDKMLPSVRNRFLEAYRVSKKPVPQLAYVQVWNLFYLCGANLSLAIKSLSKTPSPPACPSETVGSTPPIVWFLWGGNDPRLNHFKARFLTGRLSARSVFFYDYVAQAVSNNAPTATSSVKHPQGMPAEPIVRHLANIL